MRGVIEAKSIVRLINIISDLTRKKSPFFILGGGTNIIANDRGYNGMIVKISLKGIKVSGNNIFCQSGRALADLISLANESGLCGLETLAGIPGTVGGAIFGNAGAYGREVSDFLQKVRILDGRKARWISKKDCGFKYRDSIFKNKPNWIILEAEFKLQKGTARELTNKSKEIIAIREKKYKPDIRCAGSIFKNILANSPTGKKLINQIPAAKIIGGKIPTGFLLEEVGAKGMKIGGILVAKHHGNLIINNGRGKAADAKKLIDILKTKVRKKYGIELEEEIRYLGF